MLYTSRAPPRNGRPAGRAISKCKWTATTMGCSDTVTNGTAVCNVKDTAKRAIAPVPGPLGKQPPVGNFWLHDVVNAVRLDTSNRRGDGVTAREARSHCDGTPGNARAKRRQGWRPRSACARGRARERPDRGGAGHRTGGSTLRSGLSDASTPEYHSAWRPGSPSYYDCN